MARGNQAARRGGKRGRDSDRSNDASPSDEPSAKRPHVETGQQGQDEAAPHNQPKPEAVDSLAGIAFLDRDGEDDEVEIENMVKMEAPQQLVENDELDDVPQMQPQVAPHVQPQELLFGDAADVNDDDFIPTDFIKTELKAELVRLQQGPLEIERPMSDSEAELVGSSDDDDDDDDDDEDDDEDDDDDDAEEEEEANDEQHHLHNRGTVRISPSGLPPRMKLCTRPFPTPDSPDDRDVDEDFEPGEHDADYVPEEAIVAAPAVSEDAPAPEEAVAQKKKKKKKQKKKENKIPGQKKRAFYNPRLWLGGAQTPELFRMANREAAFGRGIKCLETSVTLDDDDDCPIGTIWAEMRKPDYEQSGPKPWGTPELDRSDILKACMRMGAMIDPEKMSVLVGGKHRHEDFCAFALAAMLGVLNIRQTRKKLRDGGSSVSKERHSDVIVNADELYETDDELIKSADALQRNIPKTKAEGLKVESEGAVVEVSAVPSEGEGDEDDDEPTRPFEELKFASVTEEELANVLSYVHRRYLANVMGSKKEENVYQTFFRWAAGLGMTFESKVSTRLPESTLPKDTIQIIKDSTKQYEDRRKWHTEPMPAPELGPEGSIKHGTIEVWRYANKRFSSKHMARLSLVQPNRVLDWLTFVTANSNVAENETSFYMDNNPVVSIAPVPVLFLADLAADFSLNVLSVAASMAIKEQYDADSAEIPIITDDEIRYAAVWVIQYRAKKTRGSYAFSDPPIDDMGHAHPVLWPELIQRPLSVGEDITLCDRVPANSFRVPFNAVNEARVVLDSLRMQSRRFFYTGHKMFKGSEPFMFMAGHAIQRSKKAKKAWFDMHGYDGNSHSQDEANSKPEESAPGVATSSAPSASEIPSSAAAPNFNSADANPASGAKSMQVDFNERGECLFDLAGHDFDDSMNTAFLVKRKIGQAVLHDRKQARTTTPKADKQSAQALNGTSLYEFLAATKEFKALPNTCISYHRLGWICLHALGRAVEEEDDHLLSYGSTTHYTNFGELGTPNKVTMSRQALSVLAGMADQVVRHEAEILMACASHDDGRPWIDRADVILVNSVRKETYMYSGL